jgi:hypothetical protein
MMPPTHPQAKPQPRTRQSATEPPEDTTHLVIQRNQVAPTRHVLAKVNREAAVDQRALVVGSTQHIVHVLEESAAAHLLLHEF